ncbi:hypothetical protein D3C76_1613930 [compost metagenome]
MYPKHTYRTVVLLLDTFQNQSDPEQADYHPRLQYQAFPVLMTSQDEAWLQMLRLCLLLTTTI